MAKIIIKNTMIDPIEMTCDKCKSVFSYNYQDIETERENVLFAFTPRYVRFVVCPVCKCRIELDRVRVEKEEETDEQI